MSTRWVCLRFTKVMLAPCAVYHILKSIALKSLKETTNLTETLN